MGEMQQKFWGDFFYTTEGKKCWGKVKVKTE